MKNFEEKINEALKIIKSGKKVRIVGSEHKFYAYRFISNENGKEYITYNFKTLKQSGHDTWGCCDIDFEQFQSLIQLIFRGETIRVSVKE